MAQPRAQSWNTYAGKSVSSQSVWEDEVWIMDVPAARNGGRSIRWNVEVPNGVLTDVRHRQLLHTSKALMYEWLYGTHGLGHTIKPSSAVHYAKWLQRLVRWLSGKKIYRFSDMTEEHVVTYRLLIQNAQPKSNGAQMLWSSRKKLASATIGNMLLPLRTLILLSEYIPDHPSGDRWRLYDSLKTRRIYETAGKTKRIPDDIAGPLFAAACTWVRMYALPLIAQYRAADQGFRNAPCRSSSNRSCAAHKERRRFAANTEPLEISYRNGTMLVGSVHGQVFTSLIRHLETACFVIIAGMVGMRVSEIASLKRRCLRRERLDDGRIMLLLKGLLFKTVKEAQGRPQEWLCGWDEPENPISSAIETLEALREIDASTDILFVGFTSRHSRHEGLSGAALTQRINDFASFIGIDGWHFAPHQFRKTFARFVTKRDFTGLLALQRHFAHVSMQMTELYGSWDEELLADVLNEEAQQDYEALDAILASERLAGHLGEQILHRNARFRGLAGRDARRDYCKQLKTDSSEDRLMVMRHDYGYCILQPETAACDMDVWKVGPPTCSGCANFIVTPAHAPYWKGIQESLQSELADTRTEFLSPENTYRLTEALKTVTGLLEGLKQHA